jgi:hypothetical protein
MERFISPQTKSPQIISPQMLPIRMSLLRISIEPLLRILVWIAVAAAAPLLSANPVLDPGAPNSFSMYGISSVPDFTGQFPFGYYLEGMAINGTNLLVSIGTAVNNLTQTIWSLPLIRSDGHITAVGPATLFDTVSTGTVQGNPLGGGLVTLNGGVLYTTSTFSYFGQFTGSSSLTNIQSAVPSVGGLNYIPAGQVGAGQLKVDSTANGGWYTLNLTGNAGTYVYQSATAYNVNVPALSFAYLVPDGTFLTPSVVLGSGSNLDVYGLDGSGNPCTANTCAAVTHLVDAVDSAIGFGVVRDPQTGDIIFNTGNNQIFVVSDSIEPAPEPGTVALALGGILLLASRARRRR